MYLVSCDNLSFFDKTFILHKIWEVMVTLVKIFKYYDPSGVVEGNLHLLYDTIRVTTCLSIRVICLSFLFCFEAIPIFSNAEDLKF